MSEDPEIITELRRVRRSALLTCAIVVLLTSGLAPAICWFFAPTTAGNPVTTLWEVGLRTYPLTLAVAFFTFCRHSRLLSLNNLLRGTLLILTGVAMASVLEQSNAASELSSLNGSDHGIQLTNTVGDVVGTTSKLFGQLGRFFRQYGAGYFCAAIVIGTFCGKTLSRLFPHMQRGIANAKELSSTTIDTLTDELRKAA